MTFADGARTLELSWWSASQTGNEGKDADKLTAGGRTFYRYHGTNDYTAFWRSGDATVEARALASSPEAFAALLNRLHPVGAETWLRALPDSAVAPAGHGTAVDAMLKGLPLPPGFGATDADAVAHGGTVPGGKPITVEESYRDALGCD